MTRKRQPVKSRALDPVGQVVSPEELARAIAAGDAEVLAKLANELLARVTCLESNSLRLESETLRLERANARLEEVNARLEERNRLLARWRFGRKSERLNLEELGQLALALDADPTSAEPLMVVPVSPDDRNEDAPECEHGPADSKPPKPRSKPNPNHRGRLEIPESVPRERTFVSVPDGERKCVCCGETMNAIVPISHESLEYVPEKLVVHVTVRERLACKNRSCQGDIATSDRPDEPRMTTRAGASFLAELIGTKCQDGMPLYRVSERFERLGYEVPINTLYSNWAYAADLLIPVADALMGEVLNADYVNVDDTHLVALDTSKGGEKSKGHLWGFAATRAGLIAYRFTESWHAAEVADALMLLPGAVQVDDYKGYSSPRGKYADGLSEAEKKISLVDESRRLGCMMHARRPFHEALILGDNRAKPILDAIRRIYDIEAEAKNAQMDAPARHALRQKKSIPILNEISQMVALLLRAPIVPPSSRLGRAAAYYKQQEVFLRRCFDDGRYEIDNGAIERLLREPCVGRKNFLHAGSIEAGRRLAALYSLVQTCELHEINTREYLVDVLQRLAKPCRVRELSELMPHRWAAARCAAT